MEKIAKLAIVLGITSVIVGFFGFLFQSNSFLKPALFGGFLITMFGWSFSPENFRDKTKMFLSKHWFGKYVGYILVVLAIIFIFFALFNPGDPIEY